MPSITQKVMDINDGFIHKFFRGALTPATVLLALFEAHHTGATHATNFSDVSHCSDAERRTLQRYGIGDTVGEQGEGEDIFDGLHIVEG